MPVGAAGGPAQGGLSADPPRQARGSGGELGFFSVLGPPVVPILFGGGLGTLLKQSTGKTHELVPLF